MCENAATRLPGAGIGSQNSFYTRGWEGIFLLLYACWLCTRPWGNQGSIMKTIIAALLKAHVAVHGPFKLLWWQLGLKFRNGCNLKAILSFSSNRAPRWNHSSLPLSQPSLKLACQKVLRRSKPLKGGGWWGTQSTGKTRGKKRTLWIEKLKAGPVTGKSRKTQGNPGKGNYPPPMLGLLPSSPWFHAIKHFV